MAVDLAQKKTPGAWENDGRDVADLWKEALKAYKGIVGFDLERKFDNVEAMIAQGTKEMENFHKFRHNEKKVDKLRSLFAANLDFIEQGAQQLISAAAPAFPPAAAIGTAVTVMLGACRKLSADYDVVVVFFQDMNSFLQRITILERRLPKHKGYQNSLMEVFTSFLVMCGFAHKYIELGRFKKWITNLLQGEDSDLGGARNDMDLKIRNLQEATEFAILGNTEELKNMGRELVDNQKLHTAMLEEQMQVMSSIRDTTETIRSDVAKLLKVIEDQKREHKKDRNNDQQGKTFEQSKPPSAKRIRNLLLEVEGEDHEYRILKETMVKDTCTWVFLQPQWEEWLRKNNDNRSILAITGPPGSGKSHIGLAVYERLMQEAKSDTSSQTCAAHFYFREQSRSLHSFVSAITTVINQVVEQSAPLCELINAEIIKDDFNFNIWVSDSLVRNILTLAFGETSKYQLFLMFDGIDELDDLSDFLSFLEVVRENSLRIKVAFTSRPEILITVQELSKVLDIDVTKEKQREDMRAVIWNCLNHLPAVQKFDRYVQQRVADKVEEAASTILYAEHMLERFNALGREGAVLRSLEKPLPANLHELYAALMNECFRRTELPHQGLVSKLLHWTAFSFRPLTLDEVVSLLRMWTEDEEFDIERIPEPFDKFLQVGDPGSDAEERSKIQSQGGWDTAINELEKSQTTANHETIYNDGELPVKFQERSMRSFFIKKPAKTGTRLLKQSEVHRQMFLDCAQLISSAKFDRPSNASSLSQYATSYLTAHWRGIDLEQHSIQEQVEVMDTLSSVLTHKSLAPMLEHNELGYSMIFGDDFFERISLWSQLLDKAGPELEENAVRWWELASNRPRDCLVPIIKAHIRRLYDAVELQEVLTSYFAAREALKVGDMEIIITQQAGRNYRAEIADDITILTAKQGALGIEGMFEDIDITATGCRSLASLLLHFDYVKPAEKICQRAIDDLQVVLEKVRAGELMARICLEHDPQAAYSEILKCSEAMYDGTVPESLRRSVCTTKAKVETKMKMIEAAATSYELARSVDPNTLTTGNILNEEVELFSDEVGKQRLVEVLKKWNPLERLTWLCWRYDDFYDERSRLLRVVAVESGEDAFIIQMYLDSIQYLENVNAAAPLRIDLALAYQHVRGDLEASKRELDEVLDSGSTGWPYAITDQSPNITLARVISHQSDVLYQLFRRSNDFEHKMKFLAAVEKLTTRPLALDIPPISKTFLNQRLIVLARMYLKLGPAIKFHETLQSVIASSIDALSDTVSWNDTNNLSYLSLALSILGAAIPNGSELKSASRKVLSSVFCHLTPELKAGDEDEAEEGDTPDNRIIVGDADQKPPDDEGDLKEVIEWFCDGSCQPEARFSWWGGRVGYRCMVCYDIFLCEECYNKRDSDVGFTQREKLTPVCDKNHDFIKVPIEGWRGVTNGSVNVEGEEPVGFDEFLTYIRDDLCKHAWGAFWTN